MASGRRVHYLDVNEKGWSFEGIVDKHDRGVVIGVVEWPEDGDEDHQAGVGDRA